MASNTHTLHDIINPPEHNKNLNIYDSSIIHGCMNTRKGKAKFKTFRILLESEYRSTIVMVIIFNKLYPKKDSLIK